MTRDELLDWLRTDDPQRLDALWAQADAVRHAQVGDAVHLRGLIEISNRCDRRCAYCGLRADNDSLTRYTMTDDEMLDCARRAVDLGYGTVVLQAGEARSLQADRIAQIVRAIKDTTGLAITLSLGEQTDATLQAWHAAGADRYLLRFETSNRELYRKVHPDRPGEISDRIAQLRRMRAMGYEIGGGVMIGLPGATYGDLADDLLLFRELDLDMIGLGPYIPHPATPLATEASDVGEEQVPNTEAMTYKALALTRILCPEANLPSTTALATLNTEQGRELGLSRGANVVMPNLTPTRYRSLYEIYPGKACVNETAEACSHCLRQRIASIGRTVGTGRGDSPRWLRHTQGKGVTP